MKKFLALAALAALMLFLSGCFETTTFNLQIAGVVTEFGSSTAISGVLLPLPFKASLAAGRM